MRQQEYKGNQTPRPPSNIHYHHSIANIIICNEDFSFFMIYPCVPPYIWWCVRVCVPVSLCLLSLFSVPFTFWKFEKLCKEALWLKWCWWWWRCWCWWWFGGRCVPAAPGVHWRCNDSILCNDFLGGFDWWCLKAHWFRLSKRKEMVAIPLGLPDY